MRIDHIVILVNDLDQAIADYTQLGFTVLPGGTHADGATHNALIAFADGTYLELIAFLRQAPEHRWWRHTTHGPGLIDYALLPNEIGADIAAAAAREVQYTGPHAGGRNRPDGVRIEWQTGFAPSSDLPFFCYDVTPRDRRVASGAAAQHANGVTGTASVVVATADHDATVARYAALLGHGPQPNGLGQPLPTDLFAATAFRINDALIGIQQPDATATASADLQMQLATRGAGIFAVALHGPSTQQLDVALTHGARCVVVGD